jgi:hypothetical protein
MGYLGAGSPDFLALHKWRMGWLDGTQISCVRTADTSVEETHTPIETPGGTKRSSSAAKRPAPTSPQLWTCNGGPNQRWTYDSTSQAFRSLGQCLDASSGTGNNTQLIIWDCTGNPN